jgi:murein DD-endopeptidase MepM/ murein hydrolase activator NlpD
VPAAGVRAAVPVATRGAEAIRPRTSGGRVAAIVTSALAGLGGAAIHAGAAEVRPPSAPTTAVPSAAPPPPAPSVGVTAPAATPTTAVRMGSSGRLVRDLQRELRRRGLRIAVDGAFGPATRRAVRTVQRRLRLRPTGVADVRLLRRLGLRVRSAAGAAAPGRRAPVGPGAFVRAFPVAGEHAYSDDWGAPRNQGSHEGTDIMADRHTPLVAADSGVVAKMSRTETGLGGIYLWIRRADGVQYYYAHMQSIAAGLDVGSPVGAGQVVGTVGNSGDARYGATHVHFEVRQEWTPRNPYPELVRVDPQHTGSGG